MKKLSAFLAVFYLLVGAMTGLAQEMGEEETSSATLILYNGKIVTVDSQFRVLEGLAVSGERILHVGTNEEVRALAGNDSVTIDLKGGTVLLSPFGATEVLGSKHNWPS